MVWGRNRVAIKETLFECYLIKTGRGLAHPDCRSKAEWEPMLREDSSPAPTVHASEGEG
jgi:hypothetical protein